MGLSLKKEEMIEFLENVKAQDESFRCMLWGTVIASPSSYQNQGVLSKAISRSTAPGVAGSLYQKFCYIGLTEKSLYVIAVDIYNTSNIIGTFAFPLSMITSLKTRKGLLNVSYIVEIVCGDAISLTVKRTSLGTNIKDQGTRMEDFVSAMEKMKGGIRR